MNLLLLISVFVISTCGLIYELIAGTLASYLLGDSITQFSTIIGVYLFAMGIGAWLSKYFHKDLLSLFVKIELLVGLIGGSSAAFLFLIFDKVESFRIPLYFTVIVIGTLVGIEIPLLLRILKDRFKFEELVSKVFTFDYIGALFASVLFPLVLVPYLGLMKSCFFFGILNILVGLVLIFKYSDDLENPVAFKFSAIACLMILSFGFIYSSKLTLFAENNSYTGKVIYSKSTPYQRMILTQNSGNVQLFLNGNLQFNTKDEYRYHEALVHPALSRLPDAKRVLVLGGGDGFAVREILKYKNIENITLVDLDPEMTELFSSNKLLTQFNDNALNSDKIEIINADAFVWLKKNVEDLKPYDFIVIDFPDPSNFSLGKLYSNVFYNLIYKVLSQKGAVVIQSTSPYVAKKSFWCINNTLNSVGFNTSPYHAYVPSFGDWGYLMAFKQEPILERNFPKELKFINQDIIDSLFIFSQDSIAKEVEVNRLDNQILVHYFEAEWSQYLGA